MGLLVSMVMEGNDVTVAVQSTGNTGNIPGVPQGMAKQVRSTGEVRTIANQLNVRDSDISGQLTLTFRGTQFKGRSYRITKSYSGMSGVTRMAQEGRSSLTRVSSAVSEEIRDADNDYKASKQAEDYMNSALEELNSNMKKVSDYDLWESRYSGRDVDTVKESLTLSQAKKSLKTSESFIRRAESLIRSSEKVSRAVQGVSQVLSSISSAKSSRDISTLSDSIKTIHTRVRQIYNTLVSTSVRLANTKDSRVVSALRRAAEGSGFRLQIR